MNWDSPAILNLIRQVLDEDIGPGDATTLATIPPGAVVKARILARQTLVCAGLPLAERVFRALDPGMRITCLHNEGSFVEPGAELLVLTGDARAILTGERTALNFLAHLWGSPR
jgi:nicotinate-nucleotide pyrophosphorylase (carboxylating)